MQDEDKRQTGQNDQESSIFSKSKSSAEIKAEEKSRREEEKRAAKQNRRALRQEKKALPKERNVVLWTTVAIFAAIVLIVGVLLLIQIFTNMEANSKQERPDSPHYYNTEELPEMSEEGIKGVITEVYYTNDGHLAVHLKFSNAYPTPQKLTSLEVKLSNEAGEVIATGYTDNIASDYEIPAEDYNTFIFYISPEYVQIKDDPLTVLSYEINTTGELEDPDATVSPEYTVTSTSAAESTGTTQADAGETTAA